MRLIYIISYISLLTITAFTTEISASDTNPEHKNPALTGPHATLKFEFTHQIPKGDWIDNVYEIETDFAIRLSDPASGVWHPKNGFSNQSDEIQFTININSEGNQTKEFMIRPGARNIVIEPALLDFVYIDYIDDFWYAGRRDYDKFNLTIDAKANNTYTLKVFMHNDGSINITAE